MTTCSLPSLPASPLSTHAASAEQSIANCVQLVLCRSQSRQAGCERRREVRHPFPYPVRLIPVDRDGQWLTDEALVVLGKHLSNHGLDFYSAQPLPFRRVIASFDCGRGASVRLFMDLTWCRFCGHGWYENGGRFLQTATLPVPTFSSAPVRLPVPADESLLNDETGSSSLRR